MNREQMKEKIKQFRVVLSGQPSYYLEKEDWDFLDKIEAMVLNSLPKAFDQMREKEIADGGYILRLVHPKNGAHWFEAFMKDGFFCDDQGYVWDINAIERVTHYMPIPEVGEE